MPKRHSKQMEAEDVSHTDYLLRLLRETTQQEPSLAIREHLAALAAQRLPALSAPPINVHGRKPPFWLKPALAALVLAGTGLAAIFAFHSHRQEPVEVHGTPHANPSVARRNETARLESTMQASIADQSKVHHSRNGLSQTSGTRRMILRLPYSNSAIETGNDTTIRVSISQSELLSLGFPINATVQDRRIVAELTLGDDGLPRAISLPLPLEIMKERK